MALVWDGMSCAICEKPIDDPMGDDVVATTHFIDAGHPLERYSDAAFHASCFREWRHRAEFSALYEKVMGDKL